MNKKIAMLIAEGFEEIEAIVPADIFRRLGFDLALAGLSSKYVTGSHQMKIETDCLIDDIKQQELDALILPGGMPGSKNLRENDKVMELVRNVNDRGAIVAAICAAPIALGRAGIINSKKVTCYPGFENMLEGGVYTGAHTEKDGNIITGRGPGASSEFAARIASSLGMECQVRELFGKMFIRA